MSNGRNQDRFKNRVVFITGGSSGIGEALAQTFANQSAAVSIVSRRVERIKSLAEKLTKQGSRTIHYSCDVTKEEEVKQAIEMTVAEFGQLDIVVANAGFGVSGPFDRLTVEDFRRQFETNVFGVLHTIYASLPYLKASRGTLVLVGSVNGYVSVPSVSPYCMSKFAIHALAEGLKHELREFGISVVLIAPGFVDSEIRQVNNRGNFISKAKDPIPQWLRMPTEKAAKQIVNATFKRKSVQLITIHAHIIVWIRRFFPWVLDGLFRFETPIKKSKT